VWQYRGDQSWNGVTVDFNRIMDDRIWSGGGGGKIPIWLLMKIAQRSENNAKCTILL
jgi:hypothetical protein